MVEDGNSILSGRLDAEVSRVEPGGTLPYSVTNTGTASMLIGEDYQLDRCSGTEWQAVRLTWAFRAVGYLLASGEARSLSARIPDDALAGRYRMRKQLRANPGSEAAREMPPIEVTGEFDVA